MKFTDIATSVLAQFNAPQGNRIVPYFEGAPGGGKSALALHIGQQMGIPAENITQFFASLREPVDLMGTPRAVDGITHWMPPAEIARLREGRHLLILEELSDANVPMQNALCGLIHDRKIGAVQLSPDVFIIATGNRTKDKSGANRIVSKLGGRVRRYQYMENIDDWSEWALHAGIDHLGIQFLRFRPDLLSLFEPNNFSSPTPRTWEKAFLAPTTMPDHIYLETIGGDVGEGPAAEYIGFRRIAEKMPSIEASLMNPKTCEIPTEPATLYAFVGALAHKCTPDNFDRVVQITERLKPEFSVMLVNDAQKINPKIRNTQAFIKWAVANASTLM